MIKAVVFDLDDTLYPERDYVYSGFRAAARTAQAKYGIADAEKKLTALFEISRDKVFDRFAADNGLPEEAAKNLIEAYREHKPDITLPEDAKKTLAALRKNGYKLGIITDGRPDGQKNKIAALGLNELVDGIIITDELGDQFRKPNPKAFELMCSRFGIKPNEMLYVGDNPQKDFAVKKCLPITTARIAGGIYAESMYQDGIVADTIHTDIMGIYKMLNNREDIVIIANFVDNFEYKGNSRFAYIADLLSIGNDVELITSDFCHVTKTRKEVKDKLNYKLTLLHECGYPKNVCLKRFKSHKQFGKNVKKYLLQRKKPDYIYCAVPSLECAKYAAEYARKNNVKFIVDIQDLWPEAFQMIFNIPILSKLIFAPMKRKANYIYASADEIVGVSQTYCDRAAAVNKKVESTHPVFLGIDLNTFDINASNHKKSKDPSKFVVGYCGTLGSSYDIKCAIDGIAMLNGKSSKPIEFRIFGDGPLLEEFKHYADNKRVNAVFYGRLSYAEMCGEITACDIAINPIVHGAAQSIINKHADYAAAGIPVINTQESEEYRQLVEKYKCGINCKCGDPSEVARAIVTLLNDKTLRDDMGESARKMAVERFDRQNTYLKIAELIEKGGER